MNEVEMNVELKPMKCSVHDLIGFDAELNQTWFGCLAAGGNMLHQLATVANDPKTNKPSVKNRRMARQLDAPALKLAKASVELILAVHATGKPKPGMEATVAKERIALETLHSRITAKLTELEVA